MILLDFKARAAKTLLAQLMCFSTKRDLVRACATFGAYNPEMDRRKTLFPAMPANSLSALIERGCLEGAPLDVGQEDIILNIRRGIYLHFENGSYIASSLYRPIANSETCTFDSDDEEPIIHIFDEWGNPTSNPNRAHIVYLGDPQNGPNSLSSYISIKCLMIDKLRKRLTTLDGFPWLMMGEGGPAIPIKYEYPVYQQRNDANITTIIMDRLRHRCASIFNVILMRLDGKEEEETLYDSETSVLQQAKQAVSEDMKGLASAIRKDLVKGEPTGLIVRKWKNHLRDVGFEKLTSEFEIAYDQAVGMGANMSNLLMIPFGSRSEFERLYYYNPLTGTNVHRPYRAAMLLFSMERCWIDSIQTMVFAASESSSSLPGGGSSYLTDVLSQTNHVECIGNYAPMATEDKLSTDPFLRWRFEGAMCGQLFAQNVSINDEAFLLGKDHKGQSLAITTRADPMGVREQKYLIAQRLETESGDSNKPVISYRVFGKRCYTIKRLDGTFEDPVFYANDAGFPNKDSKYSDCYDDDLKVSSTDDKLWKEASISGIKAGKDGKGKSGFSDFANDINNGVIKDEFIVLNDPNPVLRQNGSYDDIYKNTFIGGEPDATSWKP